LPALSATIRRRMRRAPLLFLAVATVLAGAVPARAQAALGEYTPCEVVPGTTVVQVSGATCPEVEPVAVAVAATPTEGEADALRAAGWSPLRALVTSSSTTHDIVATRGHAALRIRRTGPPPDLDGWSAGRELLFARPTLVPGARVPSGAVLCTSAFLVRLPGGGLGGLSASHCGGTRGDGTVQRRNVALRRPPQPGVVIGRVVRNLERTRPLDALVVSVASGPSRPASPIVDRGISQPPWTIAGDARPLRGRRVCFSGRTSGVDQCGQILDAGARAGEQAIGRRAGITIRCTNIPAREGDSGAPVYTAPRADGSVRAVGIAVIVIGIGSRMCFTPLEPVLSAIDADVVSAAR
jgi:hypothetical protein